MSSETMKGELIKWVKYTAFVESERDRYCDWVTELQAKNEKLEARIEELEKRLSQKEAA